MSKYEVISKCISDFSLLMQSVEKIYKIFKRYFIKPKKGVTVVVEYTDSYNSVRAEGNEYKMELYIDYEDKCETYLCISRLHST